jgi:hypothetical protein
VSAIAAFAKADARSWQLTTGSGCAVSVPVRPRTAIINPNNVQLEIKTYSFVLLPTVFAQKPAAQ